MEVIFELVRNDLKALQIQKEAGKSTERKLGIWCPLMELVDDLLKGEIS